MATSPNYAWAEPDNSSLVKNGASDIRTLGDAIDTSVWNVGFGQAGKNKIINGDFAINQRNFTSITTTSVFGFDRWVMDLAGDGTTTWTPQVFTAGTAPVAGYESTNYSRIVTTGQTSAGVISRLNQRIENVRTFAGQTITVSFWAKAATGTPSIAVELQQVFGSGGSSTVNALLATPAKLPITTSWARYSFTITLPSISGKTFGTFNDSNLTVGIYVSAGSNFNARTGSLGIQSNTFDIWGIQAEYGSKATPFQTASGGSPQAELAMCQRYYYQNALGVNFFTTGAVYSGTSVRYTLPNPVTLRTTPTGLVTQNLTVSIPRTGSTVNTGTWAITYSTPNTTTVTYTHGTSVLTAGDVAEAYGNNANSYIGWSAEL